MNDREFVVCACSLVLGASPDDLFDENNDMVAPYTQEEVDTLLTTKKTGGMYGGLRLVSVDWQPEEENDDEV